MALRQGPQDLPYQFGRLCIVSTAAPFLNRALDLHTELRNYARKSQRPMRQTEV